MPIGSKKTVVDISLSGLMGGHSGVVIGEGRLNAAKTMTKVLLELDRRLGTYSALISLNGGKVRNAIMHEMKATIATNKSASEINDVLGEIREDLLRFSKLDEEQKMEIHAAESENHPDRAMDYANTNTVLKLLSELPDGLLRWTPEIENLPQTSSNIGVVKTNSDSVEIHIMSRSSIDAELQSVRADIARTARSWNATIVQPEPYAGWQPVINSMINNLADETWVRVTGSPLAFVYTHGGLECGVLRARWPHLEAISVGPTIIDPHTDAEAVNVRSVNRQYRFTKELLKNITELGDEVLML